MANTSIEWTELTWNPTTGCDKMSPGCKFCYAEIMSRRLKAMGIEKYKDGFELRTHESALDIPYKWKKPALVFVNSMSDLFHNDVPLDFIKKVFKVMTDCPHLTFQVLTKRSERLKELAPQLNWPQNVWMGVSVEDHSVTNRINDLRLVPAAVRFLSCEPLIGSLGRYSLRDIDWVIAGGESGARPRPMDPKWVLEIRDKCIQSNTPFFFKQWGGRNKKVAGRELVGKTYSELPTPKKRRKRKLYSAN